MGFPAEPAQVAYDERATMGAWEDFLQGKSADQLPSSLVRSLVQNSWRRSADMGINAQWSYAPMSKDRSEIANLIHHNAELLAAARGPFGAVRRLLEGTGVIVVLADRQGVMIEAIGDRATLHSATDIHLAVGGKWGEGAVGTNGIGTALATGEPVFVHAAEHFCAGIKGWTCAGAPIRDPLDATVIGVVDLSGHSPIFRPHNLVFVSAIAREIQQALALQQREERTLLLEAFIASSPGYASRDGLVIVDHLGRATYINSMPQSATLEQGLGRGIERGDRILDGPLTDLEKSPGSVLPERLLRTCHFNPLKLGGEIRGAALVFPSHPAGGRAVRAVPPARTEPGAPTIIGESEALLEAIEMARRVAHSGSEISLLIEGETGVGKELFARLVQAESGNGRAPFVALNCGAITRDLFGSELFGHVGGAFTGAVKDGKPGVFELANGGILSLDEIGEMPLEIQPFLLRVLEDRLVRRIGDSRDRPVDLRLIASTNRDLRREVAEGRFRRDLFYRIGAVSIRVPPLRERGADVRLLVNHFNEKAAQQTGRPPLEFTEEAWAVLQAYRWPGNVRELRNLVARLSLLARMPLIGCEDLPEDVRGEAPVRALAPQPSREESSWRPHSLEEAERQAVVDALAAERGNLSKVAQRLGISRPTLYRKIQLYGIQTQRTFV
jgi:transcriptional regulator of acetoin/glycerol metabolism